MWYAICNIHGNVGNGTRHMNRIEYLIEIHHREWYGDCKVGIFDFGIPLEEKIIKAQKKLNAHSNMQHRDAT